MNKTTEKPNILFIFSDDQAYSTIHALGNNEIHTPNLDKLVNAGTTFTHTYNMGAWNGAVCVASRAMLNTGRFVWRAHALENHQQDLSDRGEMWGQLMQKAGYETYMTGKWHVKTDAEKLFEHVIHVRPGMPKDNWNQQVFNRIREMENSENPDFNDVMPVGYNRPSGPSDESWHPWDKKFGGFWEGGKHWSEVLGDDAVAFIDSSKNKEEPFFMYLAFNAPHDPRQSPKEYVEMYPLENIDVPESYMPEYPYKDNIGCGPSLRDEALAPFPRTEYAVKVNRQEYYAIISHMDTQIGRILDALEKSGKAENTYIFFTSDHGLAVGNHGLVGKQNMYDHSIRVPLFVIGPDVPKNRKIDVDVYLQDVMASTLDLAGMEKPEYIEFNSLIPFIKGKRKESFYPAIYGCYLKDMQRMIRADGFKLIVYPQIKTMRLYDLSNDPLELNDLADNKDYNEIKMKLYNQLLQLQKEMDDPLDLQTVFKI
ncbi:MAG: sulfatase-like hydrolase/transferase [Bacteroidales bacterium]|nr:sulfatase-like hydrolase/transferase [Bacteroidales bacterium]